MQIELNAGDLIVAPGMTGFARIESACAGPSIPNAALVARSGRTAFVYLVAGERRVTREVILGASAGGFTEIRSGLEEGQVVLVDGYQILEAGDDVQIETLDGEPLDDPLVLAEGDEPEIEEG